MQAQKLFIFFLQSLILLTFTSCTAQEKGYLFPDEVKAAVSNDDTIALKNFYVKDTNLIHYRDTSGATLLHIASKYQKKISIVFLLENGSDPYITDNQGNNAAAWPLLLNSVDILKILIDHGFDINRAVTGKDRTSKPLLASWSNYEMLAFLIAHGANVNEARITNGATLLHTLAGDSQDEALPKIKLLLKSGANVNIKDSSGQIPLFTAIMFSDTTLVNLLLDAGSDVNSRDEDNNTPIVMAAIVSYYDGECSKQLNIIHQLISFGANVNQEDNSQTIPLHYAAYSGCPEIVKLLLESHARVNGIDNKGNSPLHYATKTPTKFKGSSEDLNKLREKKIEIVKLLIKHGANKKAINKKGLTPYQLADQDLNYDVTYLLR
jgi:ankyrin repeat protein